MKCETFTSAPMSKTVNWNKVNWRIENHWYKRYRYLVIIDIAPLFDATLKSSRKQKREDRISQSNAQAHAIDTRLAYMIWCFVIPHTFDLPERRWWNSSKTVDDIRSIATKTIILNFNSVSCIMHIAYPYTRHIQKRVCIDKLIHSIVHK